MRVASAARRLGCLGLAVWLAACARYTALPLATGPVLAPDVASLRHDRLLPARPGIAEIARLALLNDPDLQAARARHGVAQAQLLQAGILPNPQASLSATPTLAGPGPTTAWNAGFTLDLRALLLRPGAERAARDSIAQVDAELLWQEWQVVGQARLLAVQLIQERRGLALLGPLHGLLAQQLSERQQALQAGDATYTGMAPDLAALADVDARIRDTERLQLQQRHALAALLGLRPDAPLQLADTGPLPPLDVRAIRDALPDLPQRRPDLAALRWGYLAADEQLRGTVLSQFPNISFGPTGGSDNSNVRGFGPQLSLELPVFDRSQGRIAIAGATRRQLHDEYQARLTAADGEVRARLDEMTQLGTQIAAARTRLPQILAAAQAADAPDISPLLDPQARMDLLTARYTREAELVVLQQSLLEQQVAVETLAGNGMLTIAGLDQTVPLRLAERSR